MSNIPAMIAKAFTTSTRTARNEGWDIIDEVVGFRMWGSSECFYFPTAEKEWRMGSSPSCELQLQDPQGAISRHHATMRCVDFQWHIIDRQSKNGLGIDGVRRARAQIDPGTIVTLGSLKLVAISCRLMRLHDFLQLIMGGGDGAGPAIDEAMQDLRFAQLRRDPIALRGRGNLVALARQLSEILLGEQRPFTLHDTARRASDEEEEGDVRRMPNTSSFEEAIELAREGAVCLRGRRLPKGFVGTVINLRSSHERSPMLIICDEGRLDLNLMRIARPIRVPRLRERSRGELNFAITAYALAASRELATEASLSEGDRRWVVANAETLPQLETCVRRLLAFRKKGSLLGAAQLLGMSTAVLRDWLKRHPLPEAAGRSAR